MFFVTILLLGCGTDVTNSENKVEKETLSSISYDETILDTVIVVSENIPSCPIDITEYRNKMGKGIMSISIRPGDSIIFNSSANNVETKDLVIEMNDHWKLISYGKNENYFSPFKFATNFENYGFIWLNSDTKNECEEIHLSDSDQSYWLHSKEKSKYQLIPWEDYLRHQRISIDKNNPVFQMPDENSKQIGYPNEVYYIIEIQEMWIKIALIDRKNPSQKLENMQTVGWLKWYCDGEKRINILDDTSMEDYFNSQ